MYLMMWSKLVTLKPIFCHPQSSSHHLIGYTACTLCCNREQRGEMFGKSGESHWPIQAEAHKQFAGREKNLATCLKNNKTLP